MIFLNSSTKKILLLLFISFSFTNTCLAQQVKIIKIIDSNLFELTDGRLIKLAGVDVPNINHKNDNIQKIGIDAFNYAKKMLLEKRFTLTYTRNNSIDTYYTLVHIIKEYLLLTRDFSVEYLDKGFGKFLNNVDTSYFQEYLSTENEAKNNKEGIWELSNTYSNDTLDQSIANLDSSFIEKLLILRNNQNSFANLSIPSRILFQLLISPIAGGLFAIPGAAIENALSTNSCYDGPCFQGILGGYIGYVVGTSAWTYIVGGGKDRNLSYPLTLLSGTAGAILHFAVASYIDMDKAFSYSLFFTPIIAEIIYTNFAGSNNTIESTTTTYNNGLKKKFNTHQDLYNSTKLFEVNLFRINF